MTDSLETVQREADQSLRRSRERRRNEPTRMSNFLWTLVGFLMVVVTAMLVLLLLGVVRV